MLRSLMDLRRDASPATLISGDHEQALLKGGGGQYAMPWHWHDCLMLLLPLNGMMRFKDEQRHAEAWLPGNRFAVVPSNHAHATSAVRETHIHLAFYISDVALGRLERDLGSFSHVKRQMRVSNLYQASPEICTLQKLCRSTQETSPAALRAHLSAALLIQCLVTIEREEPLSGASQHSHGFWLIEEVRAFIEANPRTDLALDSLSDRFGISRRHLTRLFRDTTGHSIGEFHQTVRLKLARDLLSDTDLSIGDIAFEVGFESGSALSRAIRRVDGRSPTELRTILAQSVKQ